MAAPPNHPISDAHCPRCRSTTTSGPFAAGELSVPVTPRSPDIQSLCLAALSRVAGSAVTALRHSTQKETIMAKHDVDPVLRQLVRAINESGKGAVPVTVSAHGTILRGVLISEQRYFSELVQRSP